jgi:hypothetical protein
MVGRARAGLLLLENRDLNTAGDRGFSSLMFRLARNIMFVSVSFALGLRRGVGISVKHDNLAGFSTCKGCPQTNLPGA